MYKYVNDLLKDESHKEIKLFLLAKRLGTSKVDLYQIL